MTPRPAGRAAAFSTLGHRGVLTPGDAGRLEAAVTHDPDPRPRAAALGALVRGRAACAADALLAALGDPDASVRRRAAELVPAAARNGGVPDELPPRLVARLADPDVTVVEAAAWALSELGTAAAGPSAVEALAQVVEQHADPLAREAAVAALGSLGEPRGLPAVLHACSDRATVRRRAVLALAPFSGPDVDTALVRALGDRDWQVRQAAEDVVASSQPAPAAPTHAKTAQDASTAGHATRTSP